MGRVRTHEDLKKLTEEDLQAMSPDELQQTLSDALDGLFEALGGTSEDNVKQVGE